MDTKNFNFIDKVIAKLRLSEVDKYIKNNDVILDFGCGHRSFLLENYEDKIEKGVGIDYDVKNNKKGKIEYIRGKFSGKLPFKDKEFNKIFLLAVLEHIEVDKVEKLFWEFKRILKDNGKIIITTPTPRSQFFLEFLAYRVRIISAAEIRDHKKYYDKNEIEKLAKKCGLRLSKYKLFEFTLNSYGIFEKNN